MALRAGAIATPAATPATCPVERLMVTLRWLTRENVQFSCQFETEADGRAYWHKHRLMSDPQIVSVWINGVKLK